MSQQNEWEGAINFWCFNPAVVFSYFKKCHSVILCSGTLSPLDTFESELGFEFKYKEEAEHVINENQVNFLKKKLY
jgi:Fanconi anemia group J protein